MANISLAMPTIHPMLGIESDGAVNHQPGFTAAAARPSADRAILDGAHRDGPHHDRGRARRGEP
jgi:hypothetical protein